MKKEMAHDSGKKELIRQRLKMLLIATAILLVVTIAAAVVNQTPLWQAIFYTGVGLALVWGLTYVIFGLVFRLSEQVTARNQEITMRERELDALQQVTQQIGATLDLNTILSVILQKAIELTESSHGYIALRNAETGDMGIETARGYDVAELGHVLRTETAIGEHVMRTGEALHVADVQSPQSPIVVSTPTHATLAIPISYEGMIMGLMTLHKPDQDGYAKRNISFLTSLSEQASIAIGNARRFSEQYRLNEMLRLRTEQQQSLFEVSNSLRMDKPLEVILEDVAYAIQDSVGFNIVLISAIQGDPPYFQRIAGAGIPLEALNKLKARRQSIGAVTNMIQDRFKLSNSYFVPHEHKSVWENGLDTMILIPKHDLPDTEWHPEDILFSPLHNSEGQLIGVISVDDPRDGLHPSQSDVEILETFAAQAALAIENAQLYGTAQRRVSELDTLNRIGQALSSTLELEALVELVYRHTYPIIPCTRFLIALHDEETGKLEYPYIIDQERRVSVQELTAYERALVGFVTKTREPLLLSARHPRLIPPELRGGLEKSWIAVPMLTADTLVGIVAMQSIDDDATFGLDQINLLRTITAQASAALQNARLYTKIRGLNAILENRVQNRTEALVDANAQLVQEKERVETLYRITSELGTSLDLNRVLARALNLLSRAIGAERGAILMLDRQSQQLTYNTTFGREQPLTEEEKRQPVPQTGVIGWVLQNREPLLLQDASKDERWANAPQEMLGQVRSILATPLLVGDEVLGILQVADTRPNLLTIEHIRLVSAAANQVAQAISNAELYNLILEQAQRLGDSLYSQQTESTEKAAILESIADGVLVVDPAGKIILVNQAAEKILRASAENLIDKPINRLSILAEMAEQDSAMAGLNLVRQWLSLSWDEIMSQTLEEQFAADDRVINVRMNAVQDNGEILGAVAVLRDITREVEADRAKSEFISTVSHELRTPMTSIKGYTDLLLINAVGELNEQQTRFLSTIKSNVDRLAGLVADLLDISRIESGRMGLEIEPIDMEEMLMQAIGSMRGQFTAQRVLLTSEIEPGLPQINGDPKRLTQVLSNVLHNACQYTLPGGQVQVTVARQADEILVTVADTGIGISEEDQKRLFERFFRADHPVVMETQGTGLGLAIIKSIVEMHQGRVWIESKLEKGTTVFIALPIGQPATADATLEKATVEMPS